MEYKRIFDTESEAWKQSQATREALTALNEAKGMAWAQARSAATDDPRYRAQVPKPVAIRVNHTGTHATQKFSTRQVADWVMNGFARIEGELLIVTAENGEFRYTIKRSPGHYCCHTGERIPISEFARAQSAQGDGRLTAKEAREWMEPRKLWGSLSPDPQNPSGYEQLNAYDCELDAGTHEKFKAKAGQSGTIQSVIAEAKTTKGFFRRVFGGE